MNVLIMAGGRLKRSFLMYFLKNKKTDYIIVVDGALKLADEIGMKFHSLVGDFDTIDTKILQKYENNPNIYIERHIPEKDETDSELAIRIALSKNPDQIDIIGALGGRMDHTLGNMELLYQPLKRNIPCYIYDEYNRISLINRDKTFQKSQLYGKYVSFIPFSDQVSNVNLEGFKYPLKHALLKKGNTLAISNEVVQKEAGIRFDSGMLFCIEAADIPKAE